jgi:hypothetical protein
MAAGRKTGGGSRRGRPNKLSADVKAMIIGALNKAGGEEYLLKQTNENPSAFLTLVGKILPLQMTGTEDGPIHLRVVNYAVDTGVPRPDESGACNPKVGSAVFSRTPVRAARR